MEYKSCVFVVSIIIKKSLYDDALHGVALFGGCPAHNTHFIADSSLSFRAYFVVHHAQNKSEDNEFFVVRKNEKYEKRKVH